MKKIRSFYEYIFFRLLLFQRKQWFGNKTVASFQAHGAISFSAFALIFSVDFIYARIVGADLGLIDNGLKIGIVAVILLLILNRLFPGDDEKLIEKYINQKENDRFWKIKGILSLSILVFPIVLLLFLM